MHFTLNRPSNAVFLISIVLALLSLIGVLTHVPMLSNNAFLLLAIAYVVLVIGNLVKGA
jgi:ABC-type siderophore export system fused ATPase/permease subunit